MPPFARKALLIGCSLLFVGALALGCIHLKAYLVERKAQKRLSKYDLVREFQPYAVPREESLLALPFFDDWLNDKETWEEKIAALSLWESKPNEAIKTGKVLSEVALWKTGTPFSTKAFDDRHSTSLEKQLQKHEALLKVIATSIESRPLIATPFRGEDQLESGAFMFRLKVSQLLKYRGLMHLEQNNGDAAFDDLLTLLRLNHAYPEKTLLGYVVRIALVTTPQQLIATGLSSHLWSDEQVATLQQELEKSTPIRDLISTIRGEESYMLSFLKKGLPFSVPEEEEGDKGWQNALAGFFRPRDGVAAPLLEMVDLRNRAILPSFDPKHGTVDVGAVEEIHTEMENLTSRAARMTAPLYPSILQKAAATQAERNLAITACALERYWQKNARYPETLAELVPTYCPALPNDPITGKALHYRRLDTSKDDKAPYQLYSVGWNGRDDGGKRPKEHEVEKPPDWLWILPKA